MRATTISSKGQIAIPKEIRDTLHIETGDRFTVEVKGSNIILKPAVTITIPKEQAYFWTPEVQKALHAAENNFQKKVSSDYPVDEFLRELKDRR